jgi:hypothetical protein
LCSERTWIAQLLLLALMLWYCFQAPHKAQAALLALTIAIEHPAFSTDAAVLCAAACACKAWREPVQQCGVCSTAVVLKLDEELQNLDSFAGWLLQHVHLVRSISVIDIRPPYDPWGGEIDSTYAPPPCTRSDRADEAAKLMQLALEAAAAQSAIAAPPPPAATAAAAAAAIPLQDAAGAALESSKQQQQQQQQGLRFVSFSTDCLLSPSLLAALPAHSTRLDLQLQLGYEYDSEEYYYGIEDDFEDDWVEGPAVSAALAQLSSLQELRFGNVAAPNSMALPGSCLDGISQLSHLTLLELTGDWLRGAKERLLQLLALPLPLRQLHLAIDFEAISCWKLDLAQQTQLQHLYTDVELDGSSVLPEQLQELTLCSNMGLHKYNFLVVSALQQLQRLDFQVKFKDLKLLLQLAALPALQHLALQYRPQCIDQRTRSSRVALETSSAWGQLPQLQQLTVYLSGEEGEELSVQQLQGLVANIAAATSLTQLTLSAYMPKPGQLDLLDLPSAAGEAGAAGEGARCAAVCASLARLVHLQDLMVIGPRLRAGDAAALTSLTSLTSLFLSDLGDGLDGAIAVALARSLTRLRRLHVPQAAQSKQYVAAVAELQLCSDWGEVIVWCG